MAEVAATTERLILRGWDEQARADFARVTNTPAVMRWLGGVANPAKLAAAFDRLHGDRALARLLGANAAERVAELGIDWDTVVEKLLA